MSNPNWNLASIDGKIAMSVTAGGNGGVDGAMTVYGLKYGIGGEWAASGSVAGRNASAFSVAGSYQTAPSVPNFLAAAGIMEGPGQWPISVKIAGNVAPAGVQGDRNFGVTLIPTMNRNAGDLAAAYAESYAVLQISEGGQYGLVCSAGWLGPQQGATTNPFGTGDYKAAGVALTAEQLADIIAPDPVHPGLVLISVPSFKSAANLRPVMIQFVDPYEHFAEPPLQEPHPGIAKIFYDDSAGALTLQPIDNKTTRQPTQVINFNHGRGKSHGGGVIEFR